jgi:hypothetical protein
MGTKARPSLPSPFPSYFPGPVSRIYLPFAPGARGRYKTFLGFRRHVGVNRRERFYVLWLPCGRAKVDREHFIWSKVTFRLSCSLVVPSLGASSALHPLHFFRELDLNLLGGSLVERLDVSRTAVGTLGPDNQVLVFEDVDLCEILIAATAVEQLLPQGASPSKVAGWVIEVRPSGIFLVVLLPSGGGRRRGHERGVHLRLLRGRVA